MTHFQVLTEPVIEQLSANCDKKCTEAKQEAFPKIDKLETELKNSKKYRSNEIHTITISKSHILIIILQSYNLIIILQSHNLTISQSHNLTLSLTVSHSYTLTLLL